MQYQSLSWLCFVCRGADLVLEARAGKRQNTLYRQRGMPIVMFFFSFSWWRLKVGAKLGWEVVAVAFLRRVPLVSMPVLACCDTAPWLGGLGKSTFGVHASVSVLWHSPSHGRGPKYSLSFFFSSDSFTWRLSFSRIFWQNLWPVPPRFFSDVNEPLFMLGKFTFSVWSYMLQLCFSRGGLGVVVLLHKFVFSCVCFLYENICPYLVLWTCSCLGESFHPSYVNFCAIHLFVNTDVGSEESGSSLLASKKPHLFIWRGVGGGICMVLYECIVFVRCIEFYDCFL